MNDPVNVDQVCCGVAVPTLDEDQAADAGLIRGEKRGRWVWWSVVPSGLDQVVAALRIDR